MNEGLSPRMLFAVRFSDRPDRLAVREEHLAAHLAWLGTHREAIRMAGSLRCEPDQLSKAFPERRVDV